MMVRRIKLILVFMMMAAVAGPVTLTLGMEPISPVPGEFIVGPEMWAVGVVDCSGTIPFATLRVKKVDDCEVKTDPLSGTGDVLGFSGCPLTETDVLYVRLPVGSVFDLPCEPIISKVKNFKNEGSVVSFDCQIKFISTSNTDCVPQ